MKTFIFTINNKYEIEAEDEDDALERFAVSMSLENQTAENEFWDNLKIREVKK